MAAKTGDAPQIVLCGDSALSVDFGNCIDAAVNARVHALDAALRQADLPGVVELVPSYRALMVHLDPLVADLAVLRARITDLAATEAAGSGHQRRWRVPVVYGGAHGEDLDDCAALAGMSPEAFIAAHAAALYRVMMIGFQPGFAYLGGLDPRLARPRRDVPRAMVPAGAISIGGAQTAIGTVPTPSGWHLIGQTPVASFQPGRDPVFLFAAGDEIRFAPVPAGEWPALAARAAAGEPLAERLA